MSPKFATPDVRQFTDEELPRADFPAERAQDFRVYFSAGNHSDILRHAGETTEVEICGVLVGKWEHDADGPFVEISDHVRADAAASKFAEVTFTHESWVKINEVMDTKFSELKIVGWYHSHPDFGIFLSDRDVFIQENFFSGPGQVAHVVDPIRKTEGVFIWRDGKPARCSHYWIGERIYAEPSGGASRDAPIQAASQAQALSVQQTATGQQAAPPLWNTWLMLLLMFLIGYMASGFFTARHTAWERQMMFEGMLKHYALWKGLRPGLKQEMDLVDSRLSSVSKQVSSLAKEHVKLAGEDAKSKTAEWNNVLGDLRRTRNHLGAVEEQYCLTAEETAIVEKMLNSMRLQTEAEKPSKKKTTDKKSSKKTDKTGDSKRSKTKTSK